MRITVVGCGNLGRALIKGLLNSGITDAASLEACDTSAESRERCEKDFGVAVSSGPATPPEVLLLVVKPQQMPDALRTIAAADLGDPLVISVAAGVSSKQVHAGLGEDARVVRAMPNMGAMVACSATAIASGPGATAEDMLTATRIFESIGTAIEVPEALLDVVTGLSGSGPAFALTFLEAMIDAGTALGLSQSAARLLSAKTLQAAATLLLEEPAAHPAEIKRRICSPGGTTLAGLRSLEAGGLRSAVDNAVRQAARRAGELRRGLEQELSS